MSSRRRSHRSIPAVSAPEIAPTSEPVVASASHAPAGSAPTPKAGSAPATAPPAASPTAPAPRPGADVADEAIHAIGAIESRLDLSDPLSSPEAKLLTARVAAVGHPLIEKLIQVAAEQGGYIGEVHVDPAVCRAKLDYVRLFGPVATRGTEFANRVRSDVLREEDYLAELAKVAMNALRKRVKSDASLLPILRALEALRPRPRRAKSAAAADTPAATDASVTNSNAAAHAGAGASSDATSASVATPPAHANGSSNGASPVPNGGSNGHAVG
jgi:hypothetical protein